MRAIRKYYFPNLCISFTLVVIILAGLNIANNKDSSGFQLFLLQFAGVLAAIGTADYFVEKIEFKNWKTQVSAEFAVNYLIFMVSAYLLHWFGFRAENIIVNTLIFITVFILVMLRTYKMMKQDEIWINQMLKKRNSDYQ